MVNSFLSVGQPVAYNIYKRLTNIVSETHFTSDAIENQENVLPESISYRKFSALQEVAISDVQWIQEDGGQ